MARTPDTRRVRSKWLQATTASIAAGQDAVIDSHTFQDDVRVIGCQVSAISIVTDAQLNADGRMHSYAELSKQGIQGRDGSILKVDSMAGWTGILSVGEIAKREDIMFPEGYGIDFDDGETIYLHGYLENIGAVVGVALVEAIVYYVER